MFIKSHFDDYNFKKPFGVFKIVIALFVLVFITMFLIKSTELNLSDTNHRIDTLVLINNVELETMISKNSNERSIGLSQHLSLANNEAMLFVFDVSSVYSFWMKDMDFPIDIFWLNENKEVVFIKENAQPSDYPQSYKPTSKALYVLETVKGFADTHEIEIGNQFSW